LNSPLIDGTRSIPPDLLELHHTLRGFFDIADHPENGITSSQER